MNNKRGRHGAEVDRRKVILRLILAAVAVVAVVVAGYQFGRMFEMNAYPSEQDVSDLSALNAEVRKITYDGVEYQYKNHLTTILFMGVDRTEESAATASGQRNGGQSDFLMLLVIDPAREEVLRIQIDRDTISEITVLGVLGNPAGTRRSQIALSHSFGDGGAQSCRLTVDAVKRLLAGIDINYYVAMNLSAIAKLNDAVGGVTVKVEDDYSAHDPAMTPGTVIKLNNEQAELFVRSRLTIGDGTNESRMRRQRAYMAALTEAIGDRIKTDGDYIGKIYDAMGDAILSDMKRGRMINVAYKARNFNQAETLMIAGEHKIGTSGFMEFYPDENALARMVLGVFFEKLPQEPT